MRVSDGDVYFTMHPPVGKKPTLTDRTPHVVLYRATLLLNNFLFIVGGVLCAVAVNPSGLYLGRFLGGMAVG